MPHALAQWPYLPGFIRRGTELKLTQSLEPSVWDVKTIDYGAVEPQGPQAIHVNYKGTVYEAVWEAVGRELSVRIGRGITQPINRVTSLAAAAEEVARTMLRYYDTERDG
jgi:hypothetical protein